MTSKRIENLLDFFSNAVTMNKKKHQTSLD